MNTLGFEPLRYSARNEHLFQLGFDREQRSLAALSKASQRVAGRGRDRQQVQRATHPRSWYPISCQRDVRRRGRVFADRYHQEIIETPRQARHALSYVLNNWRKHREDRESFAEGWKVDPFSTGLQFMGWRERADEVVHWRSRETYDPLVVYLPKAWLLSEGWRKSGTVSYFEVPSAPAPIKS